jgi:hypothetical protein
MSRLVQKVGLADGAGLFEGAGLYKYGTFDPLSLNPYLFFDAETSMRGTLEAFTLDLDPATPSTLDVITATRAGVATFTDVNGSIGTASSNSVRVDHALGYPAILVEPSATNLVESSDINLDWGFYSNDSTITQHTSDLGGINAYVLSRIGSNQKTSLQHGDISGGSTTNATASLFYKNIGEARFFQFWDTNLSGNNFVNVDTISDAFNASAGSAKITNLGNGWRRLEWTRPDNASQSSGKIRLSLADSLGDSRNSNFSGTRGMAFAGVQLEEGDVATSFIPTSGSTVTRAADDLVISGSDFDFYNQSELTLYLEAQKRDAGSVYNFTIGDGTLDNRIIATHNFIFVSQGGTGNTATSITLPNNQLYRLALSLKSGDSKVSVNGSSEAAVAASTLPTSTGITLGGRQDDTNAQKLNGHIKRLIVWPTHSSRL